MKPLFWWSLPLSLDRHWKVQPEQLELTSKNAHAYEFITRLPKKFQSKTGEAGNRFSSGERQRLALTRAFLRNPDFLLLDEATCHLDPACTAAVHQNIQKLMKTHSCVVVTHYMNTASKAEHIVVLEHGRVCGEGSHELLYKTCKTYRRLYELQQG